MNIIDASKTRIGAYIRKYSIGLLTASGLGSTAENDVQLTCFILNYIQKQAK